jgi:hypothetical protein
MWSSQNQVQRRPDSFPFSFADVAYICPLVEGDIDAAVASRLIAHCGHQCGDTYGRRGFTYIRDKIDGFNRSAQGIRYLAFVDLMDTGLECAPSVVHSWLPHKNPGMELRVVVREIESWILADVEGLSSFLGISRAHLPSRPEDESDPKQSLVNLARRSRRKAIKDSIVPAPESTAVVGPGYNLELQAFIDRDWSPVRARANSPSLHRCIEKLCAIPI